MLGLNAFAQNAFAAITEVGSAIVYLTTNQITVSNNGAGVIVTIPNNAPVTTNLLSVGSGSVTIVHSGNVYPSGVTIPVNTGASKLNVITWLPIDPNASETWVNIDPL